MKMMLTENKPPSSKQFQGIPRASILFIGIDGSLDPTLTFQCSKDTGHKLENCRWLKKKLTHDQLATRCIIAQW